MDTTNYSELIIKQLDRLEERTRNIVTRADLEALRKELVTRDSFEPQMNILTKEIQRVDKRVDDMETEQLSKQDRLWIRLSQAVGIAGFILAMFELLAHLRFLP